MIYSFDRRAGKRTQSTSREKSPSPKGDAGACHNLFADSIWCLHEVLFY
jgi:hypothetical protein